MTTQLAEKLREAGIFTAAERLNAIGIAALLNHADNWDAAGDAAYARVQGDASLLRELFAPFRKMALKKLLNDLRHEMLADERKRQEMTRDGGRSGPVNHTSSASSMRQGDEGRRLSENQMSSVPVSQQPDRREAQAAAANVVRLSLLDTFQIDGTAIGDMQAGAARAWARTTGRHVRWVEMLTANVPSDDLIKRWITPDDAAELWKRSEDEA